MMKSKRVLKELCFRQEHVSFLNGGKIQRDGLRKSLFSTNSPGTSIGGLPESFIADSLALTLAQEAVAGDHDELEPLSLIHI